MRSKRSKTIFLGFLGLLWGWATILPAQSHTTIPTLHRVGILPVQVSAEDDGWYGIEGFRNLVTAKTSPIVRDSKRFRFLSDDLVAGLWNTVQGRTILEQQHELNAFFALYLHARADTVVITARLLSPKLDVLLNETDVISRAWIVDQDEDQHYEQRLEGVIYRLINRLPYDVSVTSVQGSFITLSGGMDQGLVEGQEIDIIRARVAAIHPGGLGWQDFQSSRTGRATIIEVKKWNSIARLSQETFKGSVTVGDGARLDALKSRQRFARLAALQRTINESGEESVIVAPLDPDTLQPIPSKTVKLAPKNPPSEKLAEVVKPAAAPVVAQNPPETKSATTAAQSVADETQQTVPAESSPPLDLASIHWADKINLFGGPRLFSASGAADASGNFPLWLVNHVGVEATRQISDKLKTPYGMTLFFGDTSDGSFAGYELRLAALWEESLSAGLVSFWHAGVRSKLTGLSVSAEGFGGGDWLQAGFTGGVGGRWQVPALLQEHDWTVDFDLYPLYIGRIGYDKKQRSLASSNGWELSLGSIGVTDKPLEPVYGAGIHYESETLVPSRGSTVNVSFFDLRLLAKVLL